MDSVRIIIIEVDFRVSEFSEYSTKTKNNWNQHAWSSFQTFLVHLWQRKNLQNDIEKSENLTEYKSNFQSN